LNKGKGDVFAQASKTPAAQDLARRLENGGALSVSGLGEPAQPFVGALLHELLPEKAMLIVTEGLKTQESFQQDVSTWLEMQFPKAESPLFYPAP
jgi:hypothetical protein